MPKFGVRLVSAQSLLTITFLYNIRGNHFTTT